MTITNDGATILKLLEVEHPAAKVLCELADLQDKEVGDGTTSVVCSKFYRQIYQELVFWFSIDASFHVQSDGVERNLFTSLSLLIFSCLEGW